MKNRRFKVVARNVMWRELAYHAALAPHAFNLQFLDKYGEDNAQYLIEMEQDWFRKYTTAAYIDCGVGNTAEYESYTRACAEWLKWRFERPGSVRGSTVGCERTDTRQRTMSKHCHEFWEKHEGKEERLTTTATTTDYGERFSKSSTVVVAVVVHRNGPQMTKNEKRLLTLAETGVRHKHVLSVLTERTPIQGLHDETVCCDRPVRNNRARPVGLRGARRTRMCNDAF